MNSMDTLLINRTEISALLTIEECIAAVEQVFKLRTLGEVLPPAILGVHAVGGGFHIKAGMLNLGKPYFAVKINANFSQNMNLNGLPTIQGVVAVCDAGNGRLLALMDSTEITIIRTGAATAVAAKYLSRPDAKIATICGCGNQGRISLKALMKVRKLETVYVNDINESAAHRFAKELGDELGILIIVSNNLSKSVGDSHICITCTPSNQFYLKKEHVSPGTFIAAVGADSENKQEVDPALLASGKLVTDSTEQCAMIGELHHAVEAGAMKIDEVHAELGEIITGQKEGWKSSNDIFIFDSTGTGLQDVASATIVYEKAKQKQIGMKLNFTM
jgi:ornithine cyclodeaminase/alanine dehydrogenase-like protein (mu-crystallin family)